MKKQKILNDPVYGFINIPYGLLFDLIEHPYFQRLRRIKQVSLTHYVYPGALHTRFHHALGALHLMSQAIEVLRNKGADISEEEANAVSVAILLHDIGHGPFSHTLENTLINVSHEELSVFFMETLNEQFNGALTLAISIFQDQYPKKFLHQLVSGQLDMDRMDYLTRDSFFTGVYEGVIGYDRIIKMLSVAGDELVVEEKGIYSIEKFLVARRLMYWQVYLHKTVVAAEQMLVRTMQRAKDLARAGVEAPAPENLAYFLHSNLSGSDFRQRRDEWLGYFAGLDDYDVMSAIKSWMRHDDFVLREFSERLINRRLFKLEFSNEPFSAEYVAGITRRLEALYPAEAIPYFLLTGTESNSTYTTFKDEIKMLMKNGKVLPWSQVTDQAQPALVTKYYLGYPKGEGVSERGRE
jgi:HD superfamily phosphohydrolase